MIDKRGNIGALLLVFHDFRSVAISEFYFWYFMTEKCDIMVLASVNPAISDGNTFDSSTEVQGRHMHSAGALVMT
jgi:hypothetical protein